VKTSPKKAKKIGCVKHHPKPNMYHSKHHNFGQKLGDENGTSSINTYLLFFLETLEQSYTACGMTLVVEYQYWVYKYS